MEKFFLKTADKHKIANQENLSLPNKEIKDAKNDTSNELKGSLTKVVQLFNTVREIDNVKAGIQEIVFSECLFKSPYKCIEITKSMAEDFIKGSKLIFRGLNDDLAVLCTDRKTYDVKEVETSNSLLIAPGIKDGSSYSNDGDKNIKEIEIIMLMHNYYELKEIECVSLFRLRELLYESELSWDWIKNDKLLGRKYKWDDLLEQIPMSENQLRLQLDAMPVIEHNGFLRWLSYDLRDCLIDKIITLSDDENVTGISIEMMRFDALRNNLPQNVTDAMIDWFLKKFCEEIGTTKVFKVLHRQLVRAKASFILRNVANMEVSIFEEQIEQLLPVGIEMKLSYLEGITIISNNIKGKTISYLNIEDLPEDPRERLKILFERKESWKMAEIQHYLTDICVSQKDMSSLLVNHCRSAKDNEGEKIFCALKPV